VLIFNSGGDHMCGHDPVLVLMAEDDPGDALMVRESFAQAGKNSRFHVVPDGQRALRFLRRDGEYAAAPRPGPILLDLNLPVLQAWRCWPRSRPTRT
jgi:CheY-like chemotaxis protein